MSKENLCDEKPQKCERTSVGVNVNKDRSPGSTRLFAKIRSGIRTVYFLTAQLVAGVERFHHLR